MNRIEKLIMVFCVLTIILSILIKIYLVFNPTIGFDEAGMGYIAQEINRGATPYVDVFDHKPPLNYYPLAFLFNVLGDSSTSIKVLAFFYDIIMLLAIFFISKKILGKELAILASAIYSTFFITSNLTNEVPMTLFGSLGLYFYLKGLESEKKINYIISGILIGGSIWFKQPGVLFFLGIIIHQIYLFYKRETEIKTAIINMFYGLIGILIISIPLLIYFIKKIGLENFYYAIITFNTIFEGSTSHIITIGKLILLTITMFGFLIPLLICGKNKKDKTYGLFIIYLIILGMFLLLSKEIFAQHLIQALPFVIILSVWALKDYEELISKRIFYSLIIVIILFNMLNFVGEIKKSQHNQNELINQIKELVPEGTEIFSDNPTYLFLGRYLTKYKIFYIAPSTTSVFDIQDFCEYSKNIDYMLLTHRKKYLGKENIDCLENNFEIIKKYENIGESNLELWKNVKRN